MKKYELTCLISPDLNDGDIQKIQEGLESSIVENKGEMLSRKIDPAKRELGCEVRGKNEAYLASFIFNADSFKTDELKRIVNEKKEILRHILITKEKIREKKRELKEEKPERKIVKKIELKEIDKKIEEILNE